jgi:hypothetical protein
LDDSLVTDFLPVVDQPVKWRKSECPPIRQKEEINDSEVDHSMRKKASSIERVVDIEQIQIRRKQIKQEGKFLIIICNTIETNIRKIEKAHKNGTSHNHPHTVHGLHVPEESLKLLHIRKEKTKQLLKLWTGAKVIMNGQQWHNC